MPKVFTSKHQKIGELGEKTAVQFLMKHGFFILERNYTKPWGEIDIIAHKSNKLYFIEVKSVSRNFSQETLNQDLDQYNPEDNMHPWKMKCLARTIQSYLLSKKMTDEVDWQFDLLVVFLDFKHAKARIKVVKDIIL